MGAVRMPDTKTARRQRRNTPTKRALLTLARRGYYADICERRTGRITRDLFGCIDIVAVLSSGAKADEQTPPIICVQVTSWDHVPDRTRKTVARPEVRALLHRGVAVEVWGFRDQNDEARVVRLRIEPKGPIPHRSFASPNGYDDLDHDP